MIRAPGALPAVGHRELGRPNAQVRDWIRAGRSPHSNTQPRQHSAVFSFSGKTHSAESLCTKFTLCSPAPRKKSIRRPCLCTLPHLIFDTLMGQPPGNKLTVMHFFDKTLSWRVQDSSRSSGSLVWGPSLRMLGNTWGGKKKGASASEPL